LFGYSSPKHFFDHQHINTMTLKKTTKTSAKWSDDVFEEFIASGMKLEDLLDEDIDPTDYSWHQMQQLCDVYHVRTGGTKDEMAKRFFRARDDAIAGLAPPSAEEKEQLDSARQQVEQSDAEETAAALEDASVMEGEKKQPHVEHQQEIIDLDATIDQLKQDFAREIKEKFDTLKSAKENSSTTGDGRFIGFYNHKQTSGLGALMGTRMSTVSKRMVGIRSILQTLKKTLLNG
jgi:hypothetical protein